MSSSNTNMLEGEGEATGELNSRPNAHRKTSDEEPISPEILSLIASISGRSTLSKNSLQRSMIDKGKNKKRDDDDYDSDAASEAMSLDELITEPDASGAPSNAAYSSLPATHAAPQDRSGAAQQRRNFSSSTFSSSRQLPVIPKVSTANAQPQPAEQVAPPAGTQSVLSPVDSPVNPRFSPNYPAPTSIMSQLVSRLGDLAFGPSHGKAAGSQNGTNSNNASTKNPGQDKTNAFIVPLTPAYSGNPFISNASTTEPQAPTAFQQKTRTPEPEKATVQTLNSNAQSSSRPRATKKLTAEDLIARLDEEDEEPFGTIHYQPPTARNTHIPHATPSINTNTNRTNSGNTPTSSRTDMDYNNVPASPIDYDAALRIFAPQPQQQQRNRPQTPLQSSPQPARSRTPAGAGTRHHSIDDDRLLAIQLAEEQKGMIMDQAVAMYLEQTLDPLDDCSFDNLVANGLVNREILELIEQLGTTALEAVASTPPVPVPASNSPLPPTRADSPLGIPSPGPANGKGKSTQADDDDDIYVPLFSTNINRSNSMVQPAPTGSQSSINVFIQATTTPAPKSPSPVPRAVTSNCGICFETFQVVAARREAANLAMSASNAGKGKAVATVTDSSTASEYGVILDCSKRHGFCIDCLTQYIKSKLQDGIPLEGKGFPMRCPGCNTKNSRWEADEDLAERVLDEETLEFWRRQKILLDWPGMIYCPNSRCSELLAPPDDLAPDMPTSAECPSCTCSLCFQCGSLWHPGLNCNQGRVLARSLVS